MTSFFVNAQDLMQLDKNNGFKNFKFGTAHKNYSNIILDKDQISKNPYVKVYYLNPSNIYIANIKINTIRLAFYKDKLAMIQLIINDYPKYNFDNIQNSLNSSFGKPKSIETTGEGYNIAFWLGNKVELYHMRGDFREGYVIEENIGGFINFADLKLKQEMNNSEF